jgi:hypothetical protein
MSYIGFWIDKNGVPGRAYLGSLAIFININAYILPQVSSITWIGNFLLGCLMFGVVSMIEYCILNYCTFSFNAMNINIAEMIVQINNADDDQEHDLQVLEEVRKTKLKPQNTKNLNDHIQNVGKEVLNNKSKEVSFGVGTHTNKGDNSGKNKDLLDPATIGKMHSENKKDIFFPKSNPVSLLHNIPEEFRDTSDPGTVVNNATELPKGEDGSKSESVSEAQDGMVPIDTAFVNMARVKSMAITKIDTNNINLEFGDHPDSPVKQDFLPVSTSSKNDPERLEFEENSKEIEKRESTNQINDESDPVLEKRGVKKASSGLLKPSHRSQSRTFNLIRKVI